MSWVLKWQFQWSLVLPLAVNADARDDASDVCDGDGDNHKRSDVLFCCK